MKTRTSYFVLILFLLLLAVASTQAQTTNADFQQAVTAYQQSPNDLNKAEKVIRMAAAMDQLPPIPKEGRRHFVRGTALFKDAKTMVDYDQVAGEFKQAVHLRPLVAGCTLQPSPEHWKRRATTTRPSST